MFSVQKIKDKKDLNKNIEGYFFGENRLIKLKEMRHRQMRDARKNKR